MYHGTCESFWIDMMQGVVNTIRSFTCNGLDDQLGDPAGGTGS
jgi:hypothetical protein